MSRAQRLLVCTPGFPADVYGHLHKQAQMAAQTARAMGLEAEVADATDSGFLPALFRALDDPECVISFNYFQYDLRVLASVGVTKSTHALEGSKARAVAAIGDHPFASFMSDQLAHAHPSTRFITIEKGFRDEAVFVNPSLAPAKMFHVPFMPPVSFDEGHRLPYEQRPIDLIAPIFITPVEPDVIPSLLRRCGESWLRRAVEATLDALLQDVAQTPFELLNEFTRAETGADLHQIIQVQPAAYRAFLRVLEGVDGIARQRRRELMLKNLLRSVGKLKVCVFGAKPPQIDVDERVQFIGVQHIDRTTALCGRAKAILNCSPSYPTNIHERISVGMLYGSCVLTDVNPLLRATFHDGTYVPIEPSSSPPLVEIFDDQDVETVAAEGAAAIEDDPRFTWERHVQNVLDVAGIDDGADAAFRPAAGPSPGYAAA
ncbi:MAG: hypothetical protein AB7E79_12215 [Rhodospirillaceae bacterium]